MSIDIILFVLRVFSGLCLAGFLTALLVILWRDYRSAAAAVQVNRRVHGQLVALTQIETVFVETGATHPLLPITTIGRAPTNDIVIQDTFASSEHAQIILRNGQWWLEDKGSRNGTLLNGDPITTPIIITNGDMISIGNTSFRLVLV
jgi:pSer/pThr/pTyr-binding forkhead associated (FHA) protein